MGPLFIRISGQGEAPKRVTSEQSHSLGYLQCSIPGSATPSPIGEVRNSTVTSPRATWSPSLAHRPSGSPTLEPPNRLL